MFKIVDLKYIGGIVCWKDVKWSLKCIKNVVLVLIVGSKGFQFYWDGEGTMKYKTKMWVMSLLEIETISKDHKLVLALSQINCQGY